MNKSILSCFFLLMLPLCAVASHNAVGIGAVAKHMMLPVGILGDFIDAACFLVGGSFLVASIIRYIEHRRNPLMSPIGTVIFLFVGGLILVLLPFASLVINQSL